MNRNPSIASPSALGLIGSLWGICGFTFLISFAIYRLTKIAWASLDYDFHWYHWLALAVSILVMAYSEGYKGFQNKFSPRFAARCRHLFDQPNLLHTLLAPLFCMCFFHTTRARKLASFAITLMILGFIQIAHLLPQPWRGILDMGVVTGLAWGLISLFYFLLRAFFSAHFPHSAELPED